MVQHRIVGKDSTAFLEKLTPADIKGLSPYRATLSVFTNPDGGIIDDLMITKLDSDNSFYFVTNAGRRKEDLEWLSKNLENFSDIEHTILSDRGLIALQGPKAHIALQTITDYPLDTIKFGNMAVATVMGIPDVFISRGGYTGEDGFELSTPNPDSTVALATRLLDNESIKLSGLGARDILRLEAGLCLYGNDIDETTSPVEATLLWTVAKNRRTPGAFIGSERILQEIKDGVSRKRVGLVVDGAPARGGSEIFSVEEPDKQIGIITSGAPSPTVGKNIAMGYIEFGKHKSGTEVIVKTRGRGRKGVVAKMPFIETKYFK